MSMHARVCVRRLFLPAVSASFCLNPELPIWTKTPCSGRMRYGSLGVPLCVCVTPSDVLRVPQLLLVAALCVLNVLLGDVGCVWISTGKWVSSALVGDATRHFRWCCITALCH